MLIYISYLFVADAGKYCYFRYEEDDSFTYLN
jgi:hypothetical protein